jgi:ribosomal protein S7
MGHRRAKGSRSKISIDRPPTPPSRTPGNTRCNVPVPTKLQRAYSLTIKSIRDRQKERMIRLMAKKLGEYVLPKREDKVPKV